MSVIYKGEKIEDEYLRDAREISSNKSLRLLNSFGRGVSSLTDAAADVGSFILGTFGGERGMEVAKGIQQSKKYGQEELMKMPSAKTFGEKAVDFIGTGLGELTEGALVSAALAPAGVASKVSGAVSKLGSGGTAAKVLGGAAGSFAENMLEDVVLDTTRGISENKSVGEIAKDLGQSALWNAGIGAVLGGAPEAFKAIKNSSAAKKAAKTVPNAVDAASDAVSDAAKSSERTVKYTANDVENFVSSQEAKQAAKNAENLNDIDKMWRGAVGADNASEAAKKSKRTKSAARTMDDVVSDIGVEQAVSNGYDAVNAGDLNMQDVIDYAGKKTTVKESAERVLRSLPNEASELDNVIKDSEKQLEDLTRESLLGNIDPEEAKRNILKINIQLFAAKKKKALQYLQYVDGEPGGTKVRKFFEQILNYEDIFSPEFLEVLAGRNEKYVPKAYAKVAQESADILNDAVKMNDLYNRAMRNDPKDLFTDAEVDAGFKFAKRLRDSGRMDEAVYLLKGLERKGTESGRSVHAFKIANMLTPEGTLRYADRIINNSIDDILGEGASNAIDRMAKETKKAADKAKKAKKAVDVDSVFEDAFKNSGVDANSKVGAKARKSVKEAAKDVTDDVKKAVEAGDEKQLRKIMKDKKRSVAERIIAASEIGASEADFRRILCDTMDIPQLDEDTAKRMLDALSRAKSFEDGSMDQAQAFEEVYNILANKMPVTRMEKFNAWRKIAMLSNPKTHEKNILANIASVPLRKGTDFFAQIMEKLIEPSKRTRALGWSFTPLGKQISEAVDKATEKGIMEMRKIGKYNLSDNVIKQHRQIFKNKALDSVQKAVGWSLDKGDEIFAKTAFRDSLGQFMTARGLTEVTDEAYKYALDKAVEATFKADNAINDAITSLKRSKNKVLANAVDFVIPFSKTPTNLLVQAVQYSPVGLGKNLGLLIPYFRKMSNKGTADIINGIAKGITGLPLLGLGIYAGWCGLIKANYNPSGKDKRAGDMEGDQNYSIRIGDASLSMDWIQPASFPLIAGAAIGERISEYDEETGADIFGILTAGTDSLFAMSMLQGIREALGGNYGSVTEEMSKIATDAIQQVIPSALTSVTKAIDPVQRETEGNFFKEVQNKLGLGGVDVPFLGELDEKKDMWGDTMYQSGRDFGLFGNLLNNSLNPSRMKMAIGSDDEVTQALLNLRENADVERQSDRNKAIPQTVTKSWELSDGTPVLQSELKSQAISELGQAQKKAAEEFIKGGKSVKIRVLNGYTASGNARYRDKYVKWDTATDEEKLKALQAIFSTDRDTSVASNIKKKYEETDIDKLLKGAIG